MDTEKLLKSLNENKVDFIVIGATAFPVYGYARATLDIDLFVRPEKENIRKLRKALMDFGYDLSDISEEDMLKNKLLIRQYALETDIHPFVKGVTFKDIWKNKITAKFGKTEVYFPCLNDMIRMKKAAGRMKDLEDLKFLKKIKARKK
jgi:predicted nucleotidyltransferase